MRIFELHNKFEKVRYGSVSFPIVPVCLFKNFYGDGFLSSFKYPNVLVLPYCVCACRPISNYPPKFETCKLHWDIYSGFGSGCIPKGRSCRRDIWRVFRFVDFTFCLWVVFFWNNIIDRLLHLLLFIFIFLFLYNYFFKSH